ncbi:putative pyridoxal phosphate-dependent transferase, major domain-containing protein [Helianthus anomalus]
MVMAGTSVSWISRDDLTCDNEDSECELGLRKLLLFSGNDYLGLSSHPAVANAATKVVQAHGMGPRGSALICGYTTYHRLLESCLAESKNKEFLILCVTILLTWTLLRGNYVASYLYQAPSPLNHLSTKPSITPPATLQHSTLSTNHHTTTSSMTSSETPPPAITVQPASPRFPKSTPLTAGTHRKIAIVVDLSDESAYAVNWEVQNYLWRLGDSAILLHVRPTSAVYGADWGAVELPATGTLTDEHRTNTTLEDSKV